MKLTTIIVDDEPEARQGVALLLADDPEVEITAVCANGLEAIPAINELAPDLLFLDIQMPQVDGFEVLRSLSADVPPAGRHSAGRHSAGRHSAGRHSAGRHSAGRHSAGRHSAGRHSAGRHSAGRHSAGRHSAGRHSAGRHSAGRHPAGHARPGRHPAVIFTTAYEEYTLRAFEVHAIDYLLKPFTDERFYQALNHAKQLIRAKRFPALQSLLHDQQPKTADRHALIREESPATKNKLVVKADGRVHFVSHADIIWVEAYDYYVKVHVRDRYFLLRDSLKHLEQRLPSDQFVRIHKSSIVNRRYVEALLPQEHGSEYEVVLSNGITLRSSRSYREGVKRLTQK